MPKLEEKYQKFLTYALKGKNAYYFFGGTIATLILAIILLGIFPPKVIFFPINQPLYLNIYIELPIGTDIQLTNEVSKRIEAEVETIMKKYEEDGKNFLVQSIIGQVGEGASDPSQGPSMGSTPNKARVTVQFVKFQERRGVS